MNNGIMSSGRKFFIVFLLATVALVLLPPNVLADYIFSVDLPDCRNITPRAGTYTEGETTSLVVTATDDLGISSLTVTGTTLPSPTITTTSTSMTKTYNWTPVSARYDLVVAAINNAGNAQNLCGATYQINSTVRAWIQVTGDVHSNGRINAPGGP